MLSRQDTLKETAIKVLFINSHSADYVQDLTYSGLVKLLGAGNVVDYHWNKKYHVPYKQYPKNLGYTAGTLLGSVLRRPLKHFDAVVVGASKVDCFETFLEIADSIPGHMPVVFVDGGDKPGIGQDLEAYDRPELFSAAVQKRPFDLVYKREFMLDRTYADNVRPFPMSFNFDRLPSLPGSYKYDVSFWAVESWDIRTRALQLLEDRYDCQQNGTVRNQVFSKYKRKGSYYLQELSQCRVVLNFRGGGWDTMRYWEVPAVGTFMITQKPCIMIPDNFVDRSEVVYCKDDLSDPIDLCDHYLKHDSERERISENGRKKLIAHHTDEARASVLLEGLATLL